MQAEASGGTGSSGEQHIEDIELDEETRERMRKLMHELAKDMARDTWNSWSAWIHIGGIAIAAVVIMLLVTWLNRADYQRRLDTSALTTVSKMKVESDVQLEKLEALERHLRFIDEQNRRSIEDRKILHDQNQRSIEERKRLTEELSKIKGEADGNQEP